MGFYSEHYKKAWDHLRNHPILLVPDLIAIASTLIMLLAALSMSGIMPALKEIALTTDEEVIKALLTDVIFQNLPSVITSILVFFIVTFAIGTGATAAKFGMIRDILSKKKPSIRNGLLHSRAFFWRIVGIRIIMLILYALSFIITALVLVAIISLSKVAAIAAALLLLAALFTVITLGQYVKFPLLYKKNMSSIEAVRGAFSFFFANKKFVMSILLIITITMGILQLIIVAASKVTGSASLVIEALGGLALLAAGVFTSIYLFQAFEHYKKK